MKYRGLVVNVNGGNQMLDFQYSNKTTIVFGKGKENEVGLHVAEHSKKVLLHYGGQSTVKMGIIDRVKKSLENAGISYIELSGVVPNPRVSLVQEGAKLCKEEGIDFILAVGGGSVIDSSKAIAIGAKYDGDVWDFYEGEAEIKEALKVGVVLTIPGAGSEMSESSILSNETLSLKCGVGSSLITPVFAVMNPEFCYTIPQKLLAAGIADIMSHLLERYFTTTKNLYLTDHLIEGAMRSIIEIGPKLLETPEDYGLCAEFMWTATVAHNGMLDIGRDSDWGSHRIEHEISALYDVTHGAGMAIVFPAWMTYVIEEDIERFNRMGVYVFGLTPSDDKMKIAKDSIEAMKGFFKSLGLATTLTEASIPCDRFREMAKKAIGNNGHVGSFKKITAKDIVNILELAR